MKDRLKQVRPRHVAFGGLASASSMLIYRGLQNPETVSRLFGEAANNQIIQAGFFFTIAAFIHSGQVKREIKANFASLTDAINNVAASLREDLRSHSDKIEKNSYEVRKNSEELVDLKVRVQNVENNLNTIKEKK